MQTSLPLVPLSKYQGTDYTKMEKSSPGVLLGAPGDRLQICRQAFPWYKRQMRTMAVHHDAFPSAITQIAVNVVNQFTILEE